MKSKLLSILLIFLACPLAWAGSLVNSIAGKRTVFLGDSITQAGGYVSFTSYYLQRLHPEKKFDIFSLGLSSETLSGLSEKGHAGGRFPRPCLFERLGRLMEKVKPEVVVACYGINCGIYKPLDDERFAAFKAGVARLIKDCKAAGVEQVIIVTPPIYDVTVKAGEFNYDSVMTAYAAWEMSVKGEGVKVIDLHSQMRKARDSRSEVFSRDRVHPGKEGHLFMATSILKGLGVEVPAEDLATVQKDPLFEKINGLRAYRSKEWMKHIGYNREKLVKPQALGDTEKEVEKRQAEIVGLLKKPR
ncbi:MAG: lysophospholipase L1-like esterase [Akkermansiaceae bacterium]|jgi:lysophospholipase L1-like esterase